MKRSVVAAFAIVSFLFASNEIFAQRGSRSQGEVLEVRLASSMPRNSDWGRSLDRMAAEWARVTNNEVRLRILHDGVEGSDAKVLSSLSADNIQAALFSSFGLAEICPAILTLSIPFLIKNDLELETVLKESLPYLESQTSKTNFVVLAWSKGGWVNIFSKDSILVPDDLRKHKVATNPDSGELNLAFKVMGFHLVESSSNEIGPKLANNVINAMYQTPAAIAPLGLHKTLKNMLDMPLAPFLGGIVMNRVTWNRLGPDKQRELIRITQRIADEFDALMPRTTINAVTMMSKDGLKLNKPSPAQEDLWRTELHKAVPSLIGTAFDQNLYQQINKTLERLRNGQ